MGKALEWLGPDGCRSVAEAIIPRIDDRKSTDAEVWAPCPFHDEQEASFSYNLDKDQFSCFGCSAHGDLIALFGQIHGLDASAAFREFRAAHAPDARMQRRPVLRTPARVSQTTGRAVTAKPTHLPPDTWQTKAQALVEHAHQQLLTNPVQMSWLEDRGIHARSVHRHRLGWIEQDLFRAYESWGLPHETKRDGSPKKLWIPSGLLIPTYRGEQIIHIQIRRPEGDPRFYMMPGSGHEPAPLLHIRGTWPGQNRACIVTEASLDAILVAQECGDLVDVLAVRAAKNVPADEQDVDTARATAWFGLWLDRDTAGNEGTIKWTASTVADPDRPDGGYLQAFGSSGADIRPQGEGKMDPGDCHKAGMSIRAHVLDNLPRAWRPRSERQTVVPGPSLLGAGETKPCQVQERPHPDVVEFGRLLEKCPLVAVVSDECISLRAMRRNAQGVLIDDPTWEIKHWSIMAQADRLFWAPGQERSVVQDFLEAHPQAGSGVHGKNYWAAMARNPK